VQLSAILNQEGYDAASSEIHRGRVNRTDPWTFDAEDQAELLGEFSDNWDNYSRAHLGIRGSPLGREDLAYWLYPVSKLVGTELTVFRDALVQAIAASNELQDIQVKDAAEELLARVDGRPEQTESSAGDLLSFRAHPEIQAAAEPGKPARVSIRAYSGGPMVVPHYGRVAIDLDGLELPAKVPLLERVMHFSAPHSRGAAR
jgi:hypothetical protein